MDDIRISLPEPLDEWAQSRVAEGHYPSTNDYVTALVRRDREYEEKLARLQAAIDEGRASPIVDTSIEEIIADAKHRHGLA